MRKSSSGIVPEFILNDEGPSSPLHAECAGQMTCGLMTKLERISSILPLNDKVHLSIDKRQKNSSVRL